MKNVKQSYISSLLYNTEHCNTRYFLLGSINSHSSMLVMQNHYKLRKEYPIIKLNLTILLPSAAVAVTVGCN